MAQICSKCNHANPPEASYCYFDGHVLAGHHAGGGPVNAGSAPFPSQFVFPTGQTCRNFDQLALACQQNWQAAVDLLRQGYLASFLGGLGRIDLAIGAQEAARFPDIDRGLDQLLAKLPTQTLQAPKLVAEPSEINLGVIPFGSDRSFELHLANHGMRLLYGSVVSDCKWLTLGDPPGNPQRLFQFGAEGAILVQIRGQYLRAGNKPLEGHLVVESNGGQATITVRAEVPVKPFRDGVLAGATTPRHVAEKAKATPKEAAPLFESGTVARWFEENGWIYPVQGPSAQGLGAVQQFFEALGLATAPKVEVTEKSLSLRGHAGQRLQTTIEVKTQERRPVYAHATADQPWLDVSRTNLNGRIATIDVIVHNVPNWIGQTLQANVKITANGNQRFSVPLTLVVTGPAPFGFVPTADPIPVAPQMPQYAPPPPPPIAYPQPVQPEPFFPQPVAVQPIPVQPVPVPYVQSGYPQAPPVRVFPEPVPQPFVPMPAPPPVMPQAVQPVVPYAPAQPFDFSAQAPAPVGAPMAPATQRPGRKSSAWVHLTPALVLLLVLIGLIVRDLIARPGDDRPRVAVEFDDDGKSPEGQALGKTMRFGVAAVDPANPKARKKLTYHPYGHTNSTVIRIDGADHVFGFGGGKWDPMDAAPGGNWKGKKSVWKFDNGVHVTQIVEIVPGELVEIDGTLKSLLDTTLVRYELTNVDPKPRKVGIRVLLDTLIGDNDGVPFTVPGQQQLINSLADFRAPGPVPDFVQVYEKEDLKNPGLIALLNFKVGKVDPPDRVSLTCWPGADWRARWDIPLKPFAQGIEGPDSAVVMYWNEQELLGKDPKTGKDLGSPRKLGFSYGLGSVSAGSSNLGLTVGGDTTVGATLTVVALVSNPQKGQKATLTLPDGLQLAEGSVLKQDVPPAAVPGRPVPVTWRVQSTRQGTFTISVESGGPPQSRQVAIRQKSIF